MQSDASQGISLGASRVSLRYTEKLGPYAEIVLILILRFFLVGAHEGQKGTCPEFGL